MQKIFFYCIVTKYIGEPAVYTPKDCNEDEPEAYNLKELTDHFSTNQHLATKLKLLVYHISVRHWVEFDGEPLDHGDDAHTALVDPNILQAYSYSEDPLEPTNGSVFIKEFCELIGNENGINLANMFQNINNTLDQNKTARRDFRLDFDKVNFNRAICFSRQNVPNII